MEIGESTARGAGDTTSVGAIATARAGCAPRTTPRRLAKRTRTTSRPRRGGGGARWVRTRAAGRYPPRKTQVRGAHRARRVPPRAPGDRAGPRVGPGMADPESGSVQPRPAGGDPAGPHRQAPRGRARARDPAVGPHVPVPGGNSRPELRAAMVVPPVPGVWE